MKVTNKTNIPFPVYLALTHRTYDNGGVWRSVTELVDPPQIAILKRKHDEKIIADVQERAFLFQGEAAHLVVERAMKELNAKDGNADGWKSEERLFAEVLGKKISGAYDLFLPKEKYLIDIKNASAYNGKKGKLKKEWVDQTNILAHLLRLHGHEVEKIQICLICRDYSETKAMKELDYPRNPILTIDIPVWSPEEAERFLEERVRVHLESESQVIDCHHEERWAEPTKWKIKKKGTQKAIRNGVFLDEKFAREELEKLGSGYELEVSPSENRRCEKYCVVSQFCPQYKKILTQQVK